MAMLPKKIDKERPIALTSMAYRAWCKVRWDKFQQWSAEYSVTSPWDRAQKGSSSLDISLKRLITYEGIRARQRHGITLLLDLKEFYEHVDLDIFITQASCHGFPAVLLQGALQVYTGPRYIQGESCLSAPVRAERGIMAGCPFAVGLGKLALHPVMQELWRHPALSHLDLFVDDSGYDVEHRNPEKCASNAYRIWKEVQAQFKKIDMPVSIKKTAWVCSSKQLEDKLTGYLGPGDPTIQPLWSDLGVDCAAGKRRRVTQHKQRIAKGKQRAARLAKLQAGRHPTVKANRASIMGTALYGHEAVGLAPKRMKWLRQTTAIAHGRMKIGSTELVLDEVSGKYPDPSYVVIAQQFRTLRRLLQKWPVSQVDKLKEGFLTIKHKIMARSEHWRIVAGPLAAAVAYAKDLGWQAQSLDTWQIQEEQFRLLEPKEFHALLFKVKTQVNGARKNKIRRLQSCQELEQGVDWTVSQKMLKKLPRERANALRALQQGAIKSSTSLKEAWCVHCGCEATFRHVIWECKIWQEEPAPDHVLALKAPWDPEALWCHGLVPRLEGTKQPFATQLTGAWEGGGTISDPEVRYATDGSPGSNQDVRCWSLHWLQ